MNKIVKVTNCNERWQFVKAIMDNTKKSLRESKCIADSLIMPKSGGGMESVGILFLDESSIEQWEAIVKQCDEKNVGLKWEYV